MSIGRTGYDIEQPYGVTNTIIKSGASVKDIMKVVLDTHQKTLSQTKEFATQFDFTKYSEFRKLWRIGRYDIKYKIDSPGTEIVKSPAYLWKVRNTKGGDCKSISVFLATTLENAGLHVVYRLCHFGDESQAHVFVVVLLEDGSEIIMDSVHHTFDRMPPGIKWRVDYETNGRRSNKVGLLNKKTSLAKVAVTGIGGYQLIQSNNSFANMIGWVSIIYSAFNAYNYYKSE